MLFVARPLSPRFAASALALLVTALLSAPLTARADQQGGWELMLSGRLDARFGSRCGCPAWPTAWRASTTCGPTRAR
jgi:hypothetical protein